MIGGFPGLPDVADQPAFFDGSIDEVGLFGKDRKLNNFPIYQTRSHKATKGKVAVSDQQSPVAEAIP
jgi:hypothetical protein